MITKENLQEFTRPSTSYNNSYAKNYNINSKINFNNKRTDNASISESIINDMSSINSTLIVNDGDKTMIGTSIPSLYIPYSDIIYNNSKVAVTEYQKMVDNVPVLSCALIMLLNLILAEIHDYQHENQQYTDFIRKMFTNMNRTFQELISDLFMFVVMGYYVGEKKYESDGRYIYIKDIEPRPASSILFRVDSQGHLKEDGIIQYYYNAQWSASNNYNGYGNSDLLYTPYGNSNNYNGANPYANLGGAPYPQRGLIAQPVGTVIMPLSKCVHLAYKGIGGLDSPYGKSLLQAAYDSYLVRTELTKINRNAANFKGSPLPVVVVNPDQANSTGNVSSTSQNADGTYSYNLYSNNSTPMDDMHYALSNLGNSAEDNPYLLLTGELGKSVWIDRIDSTADLEALVEMTRYFDVQQLLCCLFTADLIGLSDKGSYSLSKTQQDLVNRNVTSIANMIKSKGLIDQIVKPILEANFNEQENFGSFEKIDNLAEDVELNMNKIKCLKAQGIKLKGSAIVKMLNIEEDAVESFDAPIIDNTSSNNNDVNSNFRRSSSDSGY